METNKEFKITEEKILKVQKAWADGLVEIGKIYQEGGNYREKAAQFVGKFYGFGICPTFFKPTKASEIPFRTDKEGAISYFVGGNNNYPEDHGFALRPWEKVRFENAGINIVGLVGIAMGNYYFQDPNGDEVKVEYSFAYIKDEEGNLRICLHHSSLPYK